MVTFPIENVSEVYDSTIWPGGACAKKYFLKKNTAVNETFSYWDPNEPEKVDSNDTNDIRNSNFAYCENILRTFHMNIQSLSNKINELNIVLLVNDFDVG